MKLRFFVTAAFLVTIPFEGCIKDNPNYQSDEDAGETDVDTDSDADGDCVPQDYQGCNEDGDVAWFDSCGQAGEVLVDCHEDYGTCEVLEGEAVCTCQGHRTSQSGCYDCEQGWGGAACAVCEIGYTGAACDECEEDYADGEGGACVYDGWCGADRIWLVDGALPDDERKSDEFSFLGTSSEPVVADDTTTLEWRRCLEGMSWNGVTCSGTSSVIYWEDLTAACSTPYGGFSDWRLPDLTEVMSLINFPWEPMIDATAFPGFDAARLWSSTGYLGEEYPFLVSTSNAFASSGLVAETAGILCVRGGTEPNPPPARFVLGAGDGSTVVDNWSGLEWQRCLSGLTFDGTECTGTSSYVSLAVAKTACSGEFGGHNDWSLASVRQLESLSLSCDEENAFPWGVFPMNVSYTQDLNVWADSTCPGFEKGYTYDFLNVSPAWATPNLNRTALCVRVAD